MTGATMKQVAKAYTMLGAAMRADMSARQANGKLVSRRSGFGSLAYHYGMIRKAPMPKVSKAGKQKARAQSRNRKAHRKAVR